jgi:hypothetical protein
MKLNHLTVMGPLRAETRFGVPREEPKMDWWVIGLALVGITAVVGAAIYVKSNEVEDWVVTKKPKPKLPGPHRGWADSMSIPLDNAHHGPYCICHQCH